MFYQDPSPLQILRGVLKIILKKSVFTLADFGQKKNGRIWDVRLWTVMDSSVKERLMRNEVVDLNVDGTMTAINTQVMRELRDPARLKKPKRPKRLRKDTTAAVDDPEKMALCNEGSRLLCDLPLESVKDMVYLMKLPEGSEIRVFPPPSANSEEPNVI